MIPADVYKDYRMWLNYSQDLADVTLNVADFFRLYIVELRTGVFYSS